MLAYIVRRLAYGAATVLGVLAFLFALFFLYATPHDMAVRALGEKAPPQAIEQWIVNHDYHHPLWWNPESPTDTLLVDHFRRMLTFDFGRSDADDVPVIWAMICSTGPPGASCTMAKLITMIPNKVGMISSSRRMM